MSEYGDLLADLRRDLLLDATTDLQPGSLVQALLGGKNSGVVTVTWAGGQQFSNNATQPHSLGRVPVAVMLTTESATISCWAQLIAANDATNIHFNAQAPSLPGAGSTALVHWVAIG